MNEQIKSYDQIAAALGLVLEEVGGEVRIEAQKIRDGFSGNRQVRMVFDEDTDEIVVSLVEQESE